MLTKIDARQVVSKGKIAAYFVLAVPIAASVAVIVLLLFRPKKNGPKV